MIERNAKKVIGIVLVFILCAAVVAYLAKVPNLQSFPEVFSRGSGTTTTPTPSRTIFAKDIAPTGNANAGAPLTGSKAPKVPDTTKPVLFASFTPPALRTQIQNSLNLVEGNLEKNPQDFASWLDLASADTLAGDYQSALTALQYADAEWPQNTVASYLLGNIYMNGLQNYPLAEAAFKRNASLNPTDINPYLELFHLYTDIGYGSVGEGEQILQAGMQKIPNSDALPLALALYYVRAGRTSDAQSEYQTALAIAQKQGDTPTAAFIESQIASSSQP